MTTVVRNTIRCGNCGRSSEHTLAGIVRAVLDYQRRPWGLRQFTAEDLDGNRFYFHHD